MNVGIKAEHLTLSVPTYMQHARRAGRWGSLFLGAMFDPPRRHLAHLLQDFTFEIREGERMALLGQNGAGKSTLLKVLNGAYAPTTGKLEVQGHTQALLSMSLGFHNQATVRENILLRGTAMGLASGYVRRHIDDILAFADIPDKINQRLYTLSSGQKMRLGFAISTSIQQDILLLDEWLGTGDANFKIKAKERLKDRVSGSKVVVLASHRAGLLRDICNRGMVIDHGRLLYIGDIEPAIKFYQNVLALQWARGSTKAVDFNDERARIYGYVDGVELEDDGKVRLKGWTASTTDERPEFVALRLGGEVHAMESIKRFKRKDVAQRFGVADIECGFYARFAIPGVKTETDLHGMEVLGGFSEGACDIALRLSDSVTMIIETGAEA
jgi:ABC-type polysaccharide/polyol phosphate transport system ATPase subunit